MTSSRRTFLTSITIGAIASTFTHRVGGQETVIDSSRIIDEPGVYELADDLDGEAREYDVPGVDVCLWVRASDVTINGNNHTIRGGGEGTGIQVGGPEHLGSDKVAEDVTICDLQVENWNTGISLGRDREWYTSTLLENVTATDNNYSGIYLFAADESELRNVTSTQNGGSGIYLWEVGRVTANSITASENDHYGLRFHDIVFDSEFTDVTITGNGRGGIDTGIDVMENTFRDLTVADNDGPGIRSQDGYSNTIQDSVIENNSEEGIYLHHDGETLVDVTIRNNDGLQIDARDNNWLTASGLRIGDATTLDFSGESTALDSIARDELPSVSTGYQTVGDGLDVDGLDASAEARFEYDEDDTEGTEVELWHYDGEDWSTVASFEADRTLDIVLDEDGVYAPIGAVSDESDVGIVVSDLAFEPSPVVRGEAFDVTATIENATSDTRTETIELGIDDEVTAHAEIELAAGDIGVVTFDSIETADWELAEYEIRVSAAGDEAVETVTVEEVDEEYGEDDCEEIGEGDGEDDDQSGDRAGETDDDESAEGERDDETEDGGSDSASGGGNGGSETNSGESNGGTDSINSEDDDGIEERPDREANDEAQSNENGGDDPDESTESTEPTDEASQETNESGTDDETGESFNADTIEDQAGLGITSGVSAIVGAGYAAKQLAERSDSEEES